MFLAFAHTHFCLCASLYKLCIAYLFTSDCSDAERDQIARFSLYCPHHICHLFKFHVLLIHYEPTSKESIVMWDRIILTQRWLTNINQVHKRRINWLKNPWLEDYSFSFHFQDNLRKSNTWLWFSRINYHIFGEISLLKLN